MYAVDQMVISMARSIKTYFWFMLTYIQYGKMTLSITMPVDV